MRSVHSIWPCLAMSMAGTTACSLQDEGVCTAVQLAGIAVVVTDSVTQAATSVPFRVYAREGTYADSVVVEADDARGTGPFPLAFERPGTYTVEVNADDYRPWSMPNVQVVSDGCHVHTELIDARLRT